MFYKRTLRIAKAVARLIGCASSLWPSQFTYAMILFSHELAHLAYTRLDNIAIILDYVAYLSLIYFEALLISAKICKKCATIIILNTSMIFSPVIF